MVLRLLVLFLTICLTGFFGQTGLFGPVTASLKAGDVAPEVVFARILSAAAWSSASLSGQ
jgi:hypothetical protein